MVENVVELNGDSIVHDSSCVRGQLGVKQNKVEDNIDLNEDGSVHDSFCGRGMKFSNVAEKDPSSFNNTISIDNNMFKEFEFFVMMM